MLRPEQLIRVLIELIFVLLGGLVVWLGLTNQILPDPTKPTWMILAFALIAWGAYAFARPSRAWLREVGLTEQELDRLRSPIGLDLGARTPEETAVSIAAELIQLRWGGTGQALTDTDGRIHHQLLG